MHTYCTPGLVFTFFLHLIYIYINILDFCHGVYEEKGT